MERFSRETIDFGKERERAREEEGENKGINTSERGRTGIQFQRKIQENTILKTDQRRNDLKQSCNVRVVYVSRPTQNKRGISFLKSKAESLKQMICGSFLVRSGGRTGKLVLV